MSKESVRELAQPTEAAAKTNDDGTPPCVVCADKNIGLSRDAVLMLRGQWLPYRVHDTAVFVVDFDTKLHIEELPNGQIVIIPDLFGPTKHAHTDCVRDLLNEASSYLQGLYDDSED